MSRYVLVTGASGFIGRHLVRELVKQKRDIVVLVRDAERYTACGNELVLQGNLNDSQVFIQKLRKYDIESCFHLAWEGIPDYSYEMSRKNLNHGLAVLDLCSQLSIEKLIITGSCWEYKDPIGAVRTGHETDFGNSFKAAKNSLHMLAHAFCKENSIALRWLRLFYVYGPGQKEKSLIPHIIKNFQNGTQPELNGAYNSNDFIYVEDAAKIICHAEREEKIPEVINVGSGYSTRVLDIVYEAATQMGVQVDLSKYRKSENIVDFWANADEMQQQYGSMANTGIREGIRKMLEEKL